MKYFISLIFFCFFFKISYSQADKTEKTYTFVELWTGTPYKLGGSTKKGIDCSKLTQKMYFEIFEKNIPRVSWEQWKFSKRIPKDSLSLGDLVFFRSNKSPSGWHVGFYLSDSLFFHASSKKKGVIISSLNEPIYKNSYRGAGRISK